jgi:hypothetical protein
MTRISPHNRHPTYRSRKEHDQERVQAFERCGIALRIRLLLWPWLRGHSRVACTRGPCQCDQETRKKPSHNTGATTRAPTWLLVGQDYFAKSSSASRARSAFSAAT